MYVMAPVLPSHWVYGTTHNEQIGFASQLLVLHRAGETDRALDLIFTWVDEQFHEEAWGRCDAILSSIDPAQLDEDLIVGFLTATRLAKRRLTARAGFATKARLRLTTLIGETDAESPITRQHALWLSFRSHHPLRRTNWCLRCATGSGANLFDVRSRCLFIPWG